MVNRVKGYMVTNIKECEALNVRILALEGYWNTYFRVVGDVDNEEPVGAIVPRIIYFNNETKICVQAGTFSSNKGIANLCRIDSACKMGSWELNTFKISADHIKIYLIALYEYCRKNGYNLEIVENFGWEFSAHEKVIFNIILDKLFGISKVNCTVFTELFDCSKYRCGRNKQKSKVYC